MMCYCFCDQRGNTLRAAPTLLGVIWVLNCLRQTKLQIFNVKRCAKYYFTKLKKKKRFNKSRGKRIHNYVTELGNRELFKATTTSTKMSLEKKWIRAVSNFITLIPSRLIRQMWSNRFWSWILKDCIKVQEKKKESCCDLCSRPWQNVKLGTLTL